MVMRDGNQQTGMFTADVEADPRRKAILDAAIQVFAELGYRGTDVQMIADRAGIGKGTVYRNYETKEGLFWAASYEVDNRLMQYIEEGLDDTASDATCYLRTVAIRVAEFFEANLHYLEISAQARSEFRDNTPEQLRLRRQASIATVIEKLEQSIQPDSLHGATPQELMFGFISLLNGVTMMYGYAKPLGWNQSLVELMRFTIDQFLRGLMHK